MGGLKRATPVPKQAALEPVQKTRTERNTLQDSADSYTYILTLYLYSNTSNNNTSPSTTGSHRTDTGLYSQRNSSTDSAYDDARPSVVPPITIQEHR